MINFFRKTRKKLADDNKFLKYWRYAIGEILLVVIGILIALSINNWNENRQKEELVMLYLQNIVENLRSDLEIMSIAEGVNLFRFYSLQNLLDRSGENKYMIEKDGFKIAPFEDNTLWKEEIPKIYDKKFIHMTFLWTHRIENQSLNQTTITEMKNIGLYSFMKNDSLKNLIDEYYRLWNQTLGQDHQYRNNEVIEKWEVSLGEDGVLTSNVFAVVDPITLLKENKERVYLAQRVIREAAWIAQQASILQKRANKLIVVIQEEININAEQ